VSNASAEVWNISAGEAEKDEREVVPKKGNILPEHVWLLDDSGFICPNI
jgi:hypothetical protein